MVSEDVIKKILAAGIQAPSGENAQPWLLKIADSTVSLFNDPDADRSLYNYKQAGSLIAHGTFLENAAVAARAFGCEMDANLFPDKNDPDFVASITFREVDKKTNAELESFIVRRATNRKFY